jgi:hypothetical protein
VLPVPNVLHLPHAWLRTSTREAGLGGEGAIPGQGQGSAENYQMMKNTQVIDHSGEGLKPGSRCITIPGVSASCVNSQVKVGEKRGAIGPRNNCWGFVLGTALQCARQPSAAVPATAGRPARDATNVRMDSSPSAHRGQLLGQ